MLARRRTPPPRRPNLATHEYRRRPPGYFTEYPEDIQLFGVSFNTQLGQTGIALQGEVSYRHDVPLQFDDVELLFAALTPFEAVALGAQGIPMPATCTPALPTPDPLRPARRLWRRPGSTGLGAVRRLAGPGDRDQGVPADARRRAGCVAVLEAGMTHVDGMPDKESRRPGRPRPAPERPGHVGFRQRAARAAGTSAKSNRSDRFADQDSWGYRAALRLDYLGLIGAWNFSPRFVWSHDVSGTTPGPGGNFVEDRYGATLGVLASYQSRMEVDVSYTVFGGAGPLQRADRPRLLRGDGQVLVLKRAGGIS